MTATAQGHHVVVGRDAERARLGALLEAAHASRSGALVLRGEAGIGKTALLEDARKQATGMHVLSARGVESESELPFGALDQLLRPAFGLVERLPDPQATALRRALGLEEGTTEERFLVSAACLSLLSELSESRPVLCLVDDAHWLDAASADALVFVARRLGAEGIAILFATREGDVRTFEAPDLPSIVLGGLDAGAAALLLARVAGSAAASVQEHLVAQAQGNALALVELPAALSAAQLAGEEPLPAALPLTRSLEDVFLAKAKLLPEESQLALLVAAADDTEDVGVVIRAATRLGAGERALDAAERVALVSVRGRRLEFRHPLVRSAVYDAATSSERRRAHRALADALTEEGAEPDRRAWHLAASVLGRDEQVAQELEDAAKRAAERAGFVAAAKALERAAGVSADAESKGRRLALAARAASLAGADEYAVSLASQADADVQEPGLRAELAQAIGAAAVRSGRPLGGVPGLIEVAYAAAERDPQAAVDALVWVNAAGFSTGSADALADLSAAASAVIAAGANEEQHRILRALEVFPRAVQGIWTGADELEDVFVWASRSDDPELVFVVSLAAHYSDAHRYASALLDRSIALGRRRGQLGILAEALTTRAMRYIREQRFDEAGREAEESLAFARELGYVNVAARSASVLAHVAALHGEESALRRHADEVLEVAAANGITPRAMAVHYAMAFLDLSRGRWSDVLDRLATVRAGNDPFVARLALPDAVEAAVRLERDEDARQALDELEAWASQDGPAWTRPLVASCRALVAGGDEGTAHFEEALTLRDRARPFDLLRIQLLYGEHLRRLRRRTDSRAHLRTALEGFERFHAAQWAERARVELRASGETARKRDPSTVDELTPQELQIARFVAEGMSNKEVAAQLFLSPRTIDYHLRHVFSKLGITSRTQLARLQLGEHGSTAAVGLATNA